MFFEIQSTAKRGSGISVVRLVIMVALNLHIKRSNSSLFVYHKQKTHLNLRERFS